MPFTIFVSIFFSLSLLVVLPAIFSWGWMVKLLVTEWGHCLGLVGCIFTIYALLTRRPSFPQTILLSTATLIFFLPLIDILTHPIPSSETGKTGTEVGNKTGTEVGKTGIKTAGIKTGTEVAETSGKTGTTETKTGTKTGTEVPETSSKRGTEVPETSEHLTLWDLFFPSALPEVAIETLPFRHAGSELPIDFYKASQKNGLRPLVVMVYGGSWARGHRKDLSELNYFLADAGFHVAAISYRLAPATHFPGPVDDVVAATEFLIKDADRWNIDPKRIYLMGRSAGGQIAEMAALSEVKRGHPIKGIISLYAPADLIWGVETSKPWHIIDGKISIGTYLGKGLTEETRDFYKSASPFFQVDAATPKHLLIHGKGDELVSSYHTRSLATRLKELGRPIEVEELRWSTHGFDYFYRTPSAIYTRRRVIEFLSRD